MLEKKDDDLKEKVRIIKEMEQDMKKKDLENASLKEEMNSVKVKSEEAYQLLAMAVKFRDQRIVDLEREVVAKNVRIVDLEGEVMVKDVQLHLMKVDEEKMKRDMDEAKEANDRLHGALCAEATEHNNLRNDITGAMFPMGFAPMPFPMVPMGFMAPPPFPGYGAPVLPVVGGDDGGVNGDDGDEENVVLADVMIEPGMLSGGALVARDRSRSPPRGE